MKKCISDGSGLQNVVHQIDVCDVKSYIDFKVGIDHVIIGSPIYMGRFPRRFSRWINQNRSCLKGIRTSLFTFSLNAADQHHKAKSMNDLLLRRYSKNLAVKSKFVASFAGSLAFKEYGFFTKLIMKYISRSNGGPTDSTKNFELTNWKEIEKFAKTIRLTVSPTFNAEYQINEI